MDKVYSEDDIVMLNHSRKLLNLQSILVKVSTNGAVRVSDQGWRGFKAAAQYFESEILEKLCMNIEGPLAVLARASVTKGVEAIVESWVSVMENHSNSARGLTDQERLDREMWVAINSPDIAHCEGIVKEAVVEVDVSFIRRDSMQY